MPETSDAVSEAADTIQWWQDMAHEDNEPGCLPAAIVLKDFVRRNLANAAAVAGLVAATEKMLHIEAERMYQCSPDPYVKGPSPCPCPGCKGLRLALAAVARPPENAVTSSPASPAPPSTPPVPPAGASSASAPPPSANR